MPVTFTSHNIVLDDGVLTRPESKLTISEEPWFKSAKRALEMVFPGNKRKFSIVDLGCLEGGYSVEFARMGFNALGVEVRQSNFDACTFVKQRTNLPNLRFVKDDVLNVGKYGPFNAVFCCGLLYHLDKPRAFIKTVSEITSHIVIIQTHFATAKAANKFGLSDLIQHDGAQGRWYHEYQQGIASDHLDHQLRWASWSNPASFWMTREWILQTLLDAGFDMVFEQFDALGNNIAESMSTGYYATEDRGMFVGIKT